MSLADVVKLMGNGGLDMAGIAQMGQRMAAAHDLAAESVRLQGEMIVLLREQNQLLREMRACPDAGKTA